MEKAVTYFENRYREYIKENPQSNFVQFHEIDIDVLAFIVDVMKDYSCSEVLPELKGQYNASINKTLSKVIEELKEEIIQG